MRREDLVHQADAFCRRQVGQADQPGLLAALEEDEATEVLVEGDQNPFFRSGPGEERTIPWVRPELTRLEHIMSLLSEPVGHAATCAVIDQESHADYACTASIESFAITACA